MRLFWDFGKSIIIHLSRKKSISHYLVKNKVSQMPGYLAILLLILPMLFAFSLTAQDEDTEEWKLKKVKNGIEVYTRLMEGSKFKEYKSLCEVSISPEELVQVLIDVEEYPEWMAFVKVAEILEMDGDNVFYVYSEVKIPWPFDNRDQVTKSVVVAFKGNSEPFIYILWSALFTFTILIIIHELLHGIALKFTGAKKIHFGAYLKKFIFYAEANRFVVNKKQFLVIALTPLFVIKIITIIGVSLFFYSPLMYFFIFVMSAHSLFCAGDIALLSIFYSFGNDKIFSFDEKTEKKSYYFRLKT